MVRERDAEKEKGAMKVYDFIQFLKNQHPKPSKVE